MTCMIHIYNIIPSEHLCSNLEDVNFELHMFSHGKKYVLLNKNP